MTRVIAGGNLEAIDGEGRHTADGGPQDGEGESLDRFIDAVAVEGADPGVSPAHVDGECEGSAGGGIALQEPLFRGRGRGDDNPGRQRAIINGAGSGGGHRTAHASGGDELLLDPLKQNEFDRGEWSW